VKNTRACDWSALTSTSVIVTMLETRGSFNSVRMSSASSRWICSAMRRVRG
jgi:hypothetical protein